MITKEAICNAALQLAAKKSLDKITVQAIADACGITRQTFYYHFQDILSMAQWAMDRAVEQLTEESQRCQSLEEILYLYYEKIILAHKNLAIKLLNSGYQEQSLLLLVEGLKSYLTKTFFHHPVDSGLPFSDLAFLVDYYSWSCIVNFLRWTKDKNTDVKGNIKQLVRIIKGELHF